jgi:hypothetical protein
VGARWEELLAASIGQLDVLHNPNGQLDANWQAAPLLSAFLAFQLLSDFHALPAHRPDKGHL